MALDLYCGLPVTNLEKAVEWYTGFFGREPAFRPNDTEAVWELGKNRYVYVDVRPKRAGNGMCTIFMSDLDSAVGAIARRGFEPANNETYANGVRKVTYRDPDGNEIGYGGAPLKQSAG